ncbi:hypothetical Protein YC6258_00861 [Gynuella sunshinyii YC6258]|uniref:Uncharacterized protein n=1 Tax=Gynuella sunshinyii YC6258 TaxID=1445510 RepID=A0A0C5VFF9_9GAMM|nr:hypothetical Protein YC6258_00861 [Gynuella sunshinyii YC6258]
MKFLFTHHAADNFLQFLKRNCPHKQFSGAQKHVSEWIFKDPVFCKKICMLAVQY